MESTIMKTVHENNDLPRTRYLKSFAVCRLVCEHYTWKQSNPQKRDRVLNNSNNRRTATATRATQPSQFTISPGCVDKVPVGTIVKLSKTTITALARYYYVFQRR